MCHRRDSYHCYDPCKHKKKNMYKTIKKECDLVSLTKAINEAGLREAIAETPNITVFGPTDYAFCKFKGGCGNLDQVLLYHVLPERVYADQLVNDKMYKTLRDGSEPGSKLSVRANVYSCPTFNNVKTINGSVIEEANIKASNGVLHKINKVLCPPVGSLLELAVATPELSILVAAVQAADPIVAQALSDPALSLTLFAPDNKAFSNLAKELGISLEELLEFLLNPVNKQILTDILLYHVLAAGTVFSVAIKNGLTKDIPTFLSGKTVDLKRKCHKKKIFVIDELDRYSRVVGKDNLATNGVAHVIDEVLLPINPLQ